MNFYLSAFPSVLTDLVFPIAVFIFGLVFGSFIGSLSWRLPRGIGIASGRSICPKCKKLIGWRDNIPLLSYISLKGKCRNCRRGISPRYFIIEILTSFAFLLVYFYSLNFHRVWQGITVLGFLFLLFLMFLSVVIFVIDLEFQIIPDEITFFGILVTFSYLLLTGEPRLFLAITASFAAGCFYLLLHLFTRGRGMGLGDAKLAILLGLLLAPVYLVFWIALSFVIGAVVGLFLILTRNAGLKSKIAFGPFMIISFWLTLFYGERMLSIFSL